MKNNHVFALVLAAISLIPGSTFAATRLPVIFAHGQGISGVAYELLFPLKRLFEQSGHPLCIAHTPVSGSIAERSAVLREEVGRCVPGNGRFHLIGHSMGGLDARLMIHEYGLGDRVASLTTLATPHRGSPVADFVLNRLTGIEMNPGALATAALQLLANDLKSVRDLSTDHMTRFFNAEVQDDPRVQYFSMGFYIPTPVESHSRVPWLWLTHELMVRAGASDNDALVSVESSKWGEFLGAWPGDHYSETGPIPFTNGPGYLEIFTIVIKNFEKKAEN